MDRARLQHSSSPLIVEFLNTDRGRGAICASLTRIERVKVSTVRNSDEHQIDGWHEVIGDPTIADAIVDRIVNRAHRFALDGETMRKEKPAAKMIKT